MERSDSYSRSKNSDENDERTVVVDVSVHA